MTKGRVIIVGGGATGAILAARLLMLEDARLQVALVERQPWIGAGIAYGTDEAVHLLNTRAGSMSALAEEPDHFWRWLSRRPEAAGIGADDPFCFVPRRLYRAYLGDLLAPWLDGGEPRLQIIADEASAVEEREGGVAVSLASGRVEIAQAAVLATGHGSPAHRTSRASGWDGPDEIGIRPDHDVLIVGTGLSMVDKATQLLARGHRGRILAVSRRGLLPLVHERAAPLKLDAADIPLGSGLVHTLRWFRRTVAWWQAQGGDWRGVVDGVRPHTQRLWQDLSPEARRRFLRHARPFWEIHRHRLPPELDRRIAEARASGQLSILAGRILREEHADEGCAVSLALRGGGALDLRVDHVLDCTGILRDPRLADGLVARLIAAGAARVDPLGIGIEVAPDCAIVGADGQASGRLFAAGPLTRPRFWEITAIPDIRVQCLPLAEAIRRRLGGA